jgi:hypothetical protein
MRLVRIGSHEIPIKANQAAKQRYRGEFGTSLTSDVLALVGPLLANPEQTERIMSGGIDLADVSALLLGARIDVQGVMARVLWACAWAADRSLPDYDQWTDAVQDDDESALGLYGPDGDLASWVADVECAVAKGFLGIDLTATAQAMTAGTSQTR